MKRQPWRAVVEYCLAAGEPSAGCTKRLVLSLDCGHEIGRRCLPGRVPKKAKCDLCPLGAAAIAAAREEGRREGIEQAAKEVDALNKCDAASCTMAEHISLRKAAKNIRALASQPKPETWAGMEEKAPGLFMAKESGSVFLPKPEPTLTGEAAREFLAEMERIENLPRDSEEYKSRAAFMEECRRIYEASKPEPGAKFFARVGKLEGSGPLVVSPPEPAVTCEGCERGLALNKNREHIESWDDDCRGNPGGYAVVMKCKKMFIR